MVRSGRRSSWLRALVYGCAKSMLKLKLRIGLWIVLTGNGFLCMGGCGVRGIFSTCVRRLLLNIMSWGRSFPYRLFFYYIGHPQTIYLLPGYMHTRPTYPHPFHHLFLFVIIDFHLEYLFSNHIFLSRVFICLSYVSFAFFPF
jgi:hypothetical protein